MPDPQNPGENVQLSKERRIQAVADLSKKFGGSSKIPETDLESIGYVRKITEDGLVRLMPQERLLELSQKDPDWELSTKVRQKPFDRIPVELPTVGQPFRFISKDERKVLGKKLEYVEWAFYPNWHDGTGVTDPVENVDPRAQNLRTFSVDFIGYLTQEGIDQQSATALICQPLPVRGSRDFKFEYDDFLDKFSEQDKSISPTNSREMYDELNRLGGYYGDMDQLRGDFRFRLNQLIVDYSLLVDDVLMEKLEGQGVNTYSDFIRRYFPRYLGINGMPQMAAAISQSQSLETVVDELKKLDLTDPWRNDERELKSRLRTASPEERIKINANLKTLEGAIKTRRQIRQGVLDYLDSPHVYVDICKREVKESQDFLEAGKSQQSGQAQFYLDATPNVELDKNPGQISGDCTADKPLPFDRPDILAYNVKVFSSAEKHVGNIYLLVTHVQNSKKRVWHLDAVQIPKYGIDWDGSIEKTIAALAEQAKAKNIDAITANNELHHISNYDYIAKAVKKYWDSHGKQMVEIDMPEVNEPGYSSFQGNGNAIVLWSKEKISDEFEGDLEVDEDQFNP